MTLQRQVSRAHASWERKCWHLGTRRFACEADARVALERELKGKPTWLEVHSDFVAHPRHAGKGRPRKEASPATYQWQVVATVTVNQPQVDEETVRHPPVLLSAPMNWRARRSRIMSWSRPTRIKVGSSAAFVFCADPLFLASSVTVSKPERIIALPSNHGPLLAGLSLSRISAASPLGRDRADHSRPSPEAHGTPNDAALVFQCFEGIELLHVQTSTTSFTMVLRLESVHRLILALLGPLYETLYLSSG
jgi:hypothetical protein